MPPRLIIFDCDGVLVDTEALANTRLAEVISDAGLPITMVECRKRFVGLSTRTVREQLISENGIELGEDFVERWNRSLPALFGENLKPVANIGQAIDAVRAANIPYCVASSGKIEKMHLTLGATGLLHYFEDVLFSAYSLERGKPFPDLFLHAAATMGVEPEDCVVIEDAVPGVQAGIAAGMKVFGYCGDPLTDADGLAASGATNFNDMNQLPNLLKLQ